MPGWWLSGAAVDLDFINDRYYDSATAAPRTALNFLSISRASIGYARSTGGVLTQFATDTLRRSDLGLLVEDARTNILKASQDLTGGDWSTQNVSITANSTNAPDGTATADTITPDVTNNVHRHNTVGAGGSIANGSSVTFSCYVKPNGYSYVGFHCVDLTSNYHARFDLTGSGSVIALTGGDVAFSSGSVESLANGFFRVTATINSWNGPDSGGFRIVVLPNNSTGVITTWTGDGSSGIYAWGAQMEVGAFPSSYIPTTTTSATRADDQANFIGNALTIHNTDAGGSLVIQMQGVPNSTTISPSFLIANGGELIFINGSNTVSFVGGGTHTTANTAKRPNLDKMGYSWAIPNMSGVLNGGTVVTASDDITHVGSTPGLGGGSAGGNRCFGYITRCTLWNTRLADATLQALTA